MMNRNDLKVGQEYIDCSEDSRIFTIIIKHIGKHAAFYEAYTDGKFDHESEASIDSILKYYSLAPKPKKKIKLIGYITQEGTYVEYMEGSLHQLHCKHDKVSNREIELEY